MFLFFALMGLLAVVIAGFVVAAAIQHIKMSLDLSKIDKKIAYYKTETLIEISTVLKDLKNAKNDNERKQLEKRLKDIQSYIKTYY